MGPDRAVSIIAVRGSAVIFDGAWSGTTFAARGFGDAIIGTGKGALFAAVAAGKTFCLHWPQLLLAAPYVYSAHTWQSRCVSHR